MSSADERMEERILLPGRRARVVGHGEARARLLQALAGERPHHGWLISGVPGVGKATLAWHVARLLLAYPGDALANAPEEGVPEHHPVFQQMAAGAHPDFFLLRRTRGSNKRLRAQIAVEDARALGHFLSLTSAGGGRRVVIVDAADEMNRETANAILKLLEEPPPNTFFFLVSHAPGKLLPTIRSRCLHVVLSPLSPDEVRQALGGLQALEGVDVATLDAAISMSGGAPGRALDLATSMAPELWQEVERALAARADVSALASRIGQALAGAEARSDFSLFNELMAQWLHERMRRAALAGDAAGAARLAEALAEMRERLAALEAVNLDRRQFIEGMLHRLAAFRVEPGRVA